MKNKIIICLSIVFVLLIIGVLLIFNNNNNKSIKKFYLEDNYYGTNKITEVDYEGLNKLITNHESFAIFIYQPMCTVSADFESVLNKFLEDKKISIYKISFSNIKNTDIGEFIKYYPSFIIYNKGKVVDYLESDKDEDVEFYTSKDGFEKWFTKYVKLKDVTSNITPSSNIDEEENIDVKDINLKDVKRVKNKVNIYFFWGDGCKHCEREKEFFKVAEEKYGKYYNLHMYEVWNNEENAKLLKVFAKMMEDEISGVPYTIIGETTFKGFGDGSEDKFIEAIEKEHKNKFDVYFDKIKK